MKKIVCIFLLATTACSKEEEVPKCYACEMTYAGGQPASIQYPCTTNLAEWQKAQKDNNGEPITSSCKAL